MRASQPHYENGKNYDIIDFVKDYNLNFNKVNIIKYISRADKKNHELMDLLKAKDYLEREIEYVRKRGTKE